METPTPTSRPFEIIEAISEPRKNRHACGSVDVRPLVCARCRMRQLCCNILHNGDGDLVATAIEQVGSEAQ